MNTSKAFALFAIGLLLLSVACGPNVDVKKDLAITDVTTGFFDAGIVQTSNGEENKIVPTIAFRLKNVSDKTVASVQIDAVYHQVNDKASEWGTTWVKGIDAEGLKPGQSTPEIVLKSDRGYTSLQPRAQMLQNRNFVDVSVDILLKQGANKYAKVGDFKIDRQLLTQ